MNFGIFGDIHFSYRSPVRRIDNYFETQMRKFEESLIFFKDNNCEYIFQSGDWFDSPNVSNYIIAEIIYMLKKYGVIIFCCWGQHDITGHSGKTFKRSPLRLLEAAGVVNICNKPVEEKDNITIYSASFGQSIPKVINKDAFNILITHRMVGDRQLYPEQKLKSPAKFLSENVDYDLVIFGDYHYRFVATETTSSKKQTAINAGCLVRKTINKFDLEHEPACVVFNNNTHNVIINKLDVKPVNEVFNLKKIEDTDSHHSFDRFIQSIKKQKNNDSIDWKATLVKLMKERKCKESIKDIIDDALLELNDNVNK